MALSAMPRSSAVTGKDFPGSVLGKQDAAEVRDLLGVADPGIVAFAGSQFGPASAAVVAFVDKQPCDPEYFVDGPRRSEQLHVAVGSFSSKSAHQLRGTAMQSRAAEEYIGNEAGVEVYCGGQGDVWMASRRAPSSHNHSSPAYLSKYS